jgi:hypothetical protein
LSNCIFYEQMCKPNLSVKISYSMQHQVYNEKYWKNFILYFLFHGTATVIAINLFWVHNSLSKKSRLKGYGCLPLQKIYYISEDYYSEQNDEKNSLT